MYKSKLEICEAILETLIKRPMKIDTIAYKTNMDCLTVKRYLDFLRDNGLVEERVSDKGHFYAISWRGRAIFRVLNFQRQMDKLTRTVGTVNVPMEKPPSLENGKDDEG
ncbi:MAG: winged helix-turn-helix domain-containing protein [Candidatus Bathyarchaeia archaeon]